MASNARYFIATTFLCVTVLGCLGEPSRYAATGIVSMDGAPAPHVILRFYPVGSSSATGGSGATDADGKFTVGEAGKNTGFLSGEYKVTFSQTLVKGKPTLGASGGKKSERFRDEKEAVADD